MIMNKDNSRQRVAGIFLFISELSGAGIIDQILKKVGVD